jgi:hypothetical protein
MWPFGSKDKSQDNKEDAKKMNSGSPGAVPPRPNPSSNTSPGQIPGAAGSPQGAGAVAQAGPQNPPVKPLSIHFDGASVEAIKGSFVRMANAFDELKRLNEEHKRIQESNLKLFSGEKDREIAELKKAIAGWNAAVEARDKEIKQKAQMLEDSTNDLNRLNKDLFEKSEEVKRREKEIVEVRKDIAAVNSSLEGEKSSHGALKEAHKSLQESETTLKVKQAELVATVVDLNTQVRSGLEAIDGLRKEMEDLRGVMSRRLAQFVPKGILESKIGAQVVAFDDEAASGDASALGVIAGLSQLRAAFVPGAGPDDTKAAVKSIGLALYAAWSGKSQDAKTIHAHFAQWQEFLNDIPGAGYQLVLPDLGQTPPTTVTAPAGLTKVSEVQLWIIKAADGGIYARGVVR